MYAPSDIGFSGTFKCKFAAENTFQSSQSKQEKDVVMFKAPLFLQVVTNPVMSHA